MGATIAHHARAVIGATTEITTTGATANVQMLANPETAGPAVFLIMCDQAVYLKMGGSAVTATTSNFRLPADTSIVVTVEKTSHSYLAALQFDTAGTVKITRLDDQSP